MFMYLAITEQPQSTSHRPEADSQGAGKSHIRFKFGAPGLTWLPWQPLGGASISLNNATFGFFRKKEIFSSQICPWIIFISLYINLFNLQLLLCRWLIFSEFRTFPLPLILWLLWRSQDGVIINLDCRPTLFQLSSSERSGDSIGFMNHFVAFAIAR